MASHHEPFGAMGPVDWQAVPQDEIKEFLDDIFAETQTVVESIPAPAAKAAAATTTGRARSKTESAVVIGDIQRAPSQRQTAAAISQAQDIRKEWKEVKLNQRDNPLGINVYKLSAKDGRGSWFARRSVHDGLSFDDWKKGLDMEFAETMKIQGSPGSGNIRGIGADKRAEDQTVEGAGHLQVFQLSAQFPGPTAPRDFVTLLLTSETSVKPADGSRPLRQFMIVSKPCNHPECPPRQGIIRGYYESVELVREIPIDMVANKRSLSSADLGRDESKRRSTVNGNDKHDASASVADDYPTAIEWLMITRSDPGGSVPRFLIEKGTPPGIVGDAGKFVKWVTSKSIQGFLDPIDDDVTTDPEGAELVKEKTITTPNILNITSTNADRRNEQLDQDDETVPSSNGLYGIITGAFGAASSLVSSSLLRIGAYSDVGSNESGSDAPTAEEEHHEDESVASDTSSIRSFASALERSATEDKSPESTTETQSEKSNQQPGHRDRELKKLQDRRRKLDEKVSKMVERRNNKLQGEKEKDAASIARMREKHDREVAKQEEKYRREVRKLEEKRESERRKVEERQRKAQEREEKANMTLELEKVRAERDLANRKIEILDIQVGELQAQNTMLVRKLGKMGLLDRTDSSSSSKSLKGVDSKTTSLAL
ncbi:SNF1-interacting protein [Neonectria punicea]|uniref:SNF1-interacting protein n=1 Tax=Neonectria punicea TaxID=979145 RepID=A0ABR1H0P7_9HYPO